MTLKSVLDIDVNDSKFQRFQALFEKYQAALAKSPGMWKAVDKAANAAGSQFEKMAAALMAQNQLSREGAEASRAQDRHLTRSDQLWTSMAKSTRSIAGNILSATRSLLSWSGIISGIGGLLGAGSLWGLDHMAANAANQRRSSTGLGMSSGEQRAFQVNFSRLVNPDAYLNWVNQIETDPTKAWSAYALGAAPTGNTEKDAVRILQALRSKAQSTPTSQLGLLQQQFGLSGVSTEDLRRLQTMSGGEFNQLLGSNRRDIGALGISDPTLKKWQDFNNQLERAGAQIFKVFVNGLTPLIGPLEHLSQGVVHFLEILMRKDGIVEQGINKLAGWLDSFAGSLDSSQWQSTFEHFTSSIGDMADLIHTVAHPLDTVGDWGGKKLQGASQWLAPDPGIVTSSKEEYRKYLGRLESKYNLPDGLLSQVWQKESSSALYPMKSSRAGAIGAFQFMPDTAKQYGINPRDPLQSANGAAQYLFDLEKKYGGDTNKALAAYNWGPGNLDSTLAAHPKDWKKYLPDETRNYIGGGSNMVQAQSPGVRIELYNNTGGNVGVAASQLAH